MIFGILGILAQQDYILAIGVELRNKFQTTLKVTFVIHKIPILYTPHQSFAHSLSIGEGNKRPIEIYII